MSRVEPKADGVQLWQGGCTWKTSDADVGWSFWSSKPGDIDAEQRDALKGAYALHGIGKMAGLNGKTGKWTGLANGGFYFCDD